MKAIYEKPLASVEVLSLDQPIAANCTAIDEAYAMQSLGFFTDEASCPPINDGSGGQMGDSGTPDEDGDTLCYLSSTGILMFS